MFILEIALCSKYLNHAMKCECQKMLRNAKQPNQLTIIMLNERVESAFLRKTSIIHRY